MSEKLHFEIHFYAMAWQGGALENFRHRTYAVVTCEIILFQNYFSLRWRPSEI